MASEVIVLVADDNHLAHAKHVMVNCRREGQWEGDFLLIVPEGLDTADMESRGIAVYPVPASGFLTKFWIFSERVRSWRAALYLDCDVIVMSALAPLFQQLADYVPLEDGSQPIIADMEDCPAWMTLEKASHGSKERHELFNALVREFPDVLNDFWNSAMLLYGPSTIPDGSVARLEEVQSRYELINNPAEGGTDQQIIHCVLFQRIRRIKEKLWCFWGLDEPNARVQSDSRGWHGREVPIVLHYTRWYAPWIVKQPEAEAYYNDRIRHVCHEFYTDNLAAFDEVFPT